MKVCAFTGHRLINGTHRAHLGGLLSRAIGYAYERGCRRFITGGAVGFDTEAAREVVRFRMSHPDVSLVIFIPCFDQDAGWSAQSRASYEYLLSSADEVKYLSEAYDRGCMKRRNLAMAKECDMMIAYVNRSNSGAAQTLRMAVSEGKEVYNIYGELEKMSSL